ncbi:MAG TPA: class I SAM-dependent methyltransferase [Gemmataceae bacterium]|nr:class I SAM-dependent methyltransferase [Gemmataceae bacterium]
MHGTYPDIGGIARLIRRTDDAPLEGVFDSHWTDQAAELIPPSKLAAASSFLAPFVDSLRRELGDHPPLVLDAGAGDGVHACVLDQTTQAIAYVGFDLSIEALRVLQRRLPASATLVQGDVAVLPFVDNTFDAVFSFGVLGYTSTPQRAFSEMCRVTRPGGMIGLWVYPDRQTFSMRLFRMVRWLAEITGSWGKYLLANAIVPFLPVLPTRSKVHLGNATWKQCREVVMVNFYPGLYFPTRDEVRRWFEDCGVDITADDVTEPITLWGVKKACY